MSVKKLVKKVKNAFKKAFSRKDRKIKTSAAKYDNSSDRFLLLYCMLIRIQHRPMKAAYDDDYVSEDELDKISGDSISLYTCEMPEERLAKIKALMGKSNAYNLGNPPIR